MRTLLLRSAFVTINLLVAACATAQTYTVSNIAEARVDPDPVFVENDPFDGLRTFSYGSSFTTGSTSSILSSVTVALANGGFGSGFTLTVNEISSGLPGSVIETLSGNSSPTTAASYTFTSSGITLAANTTYAIVASAGSNPDASFNMHRTVSNGQTGSTGWTIGDSGYQNSDGWYADPAKIVFSVSATSAVPEPSTYAAIFGALALGAVGIVRHRRANNAKA